MGEAGVVHSHGGRFVSLIGAGLELFHGNPGPMAPGHQSRRDCGGGGRGVRNAHSARRRRIAVKITDISTVVVDAERGRTWLFVEITTDTGEVGIGEASAEQIRCWRAIAHPATEAAVGGGTEWT